MEVYLYHLTQVVSQGIGLERLREAVARLERMEV